MVVEMMYKVVQHYQNQDLCVLMMELIVNCVLQDLVILLDQEKLLLKLKWKIQLVQLLSLLNGFFKHGI